MAIRKHASPQTAYRHARAKVADLEAALSSEARRRPKSPQAKGWQTRHLNAIERSLRAYKGNITKARKKIAAQTAFKRSAAKSATEKRSAAARKGIAARQPAAIAPTPAQAAAVYMPFLTENGWIYILAMGDDRHAIGRHFGVIAHYLETGDPSKLAEFKNRSIYDYERRRRFSFVTDPAIILRYADEVPEGFYKTRDEARLAA